MIFELVKTWKAEDDYRKTFWIAPRYQPRTRFMLLRGGREKL